ESGLHKHDQEASDQHPRIVDRVQIVDNAIIQIGRLKLFRDITLAITRWRRPDSRSATGGIGPGRLLRIIRRREIRRQVWRCRWSLTRNSRLRLLGERHTHTHKHPKPYG